MLTFDLQQLVAVLAYFMSLQFFFTLSLLQPPTKATNGPITGVHGHTSVTEKTMLPLSRRSQTLLSFKTESRVPWWFVWSCIWAMRWCTTPLDYLITVHLS